LALPDAVPRIEPRARLGNPPFYEVYGQRYTVLPAASGYLERGVASWYGPDFHGERTSTGEPYDMYSMTAAHKTLPLPAYARVTNLANGRSVIVRVNDRGPFKANRIIDLSYAAALRLDMVRNGTTLVEVRAVEPDGPPPPPPRPSEIYAQAGAFAVEANATHLRDRLAAAGIDKVLVRADAPGDRALYRVRLGPIGSVAEFDALVARLHALGVASVTLAPN
jgi:rare lipoprotein A